MGTVIAPTSAERYQNESMDSGGGEQKRGFEDQRTYVEMAYQTVVSGRLWIIT